MKYLFNLITFFVPFFASAQIVLIQGTPQSDLLLRDFQKTNPQTMSIAKFMAQDLLVKQKNNYIYQLADLCLNETDTLNACFVRLHELVQDGKIGERNRVLLIEMLLKMNKRPLAQKRTADISKLICRFIDYQQQIDRSLCSQVVIAFKALKNIYPHLDYLMIDGVLHSADLIDGNRLSDSEHVWTFFSNYHKSQTFIGTYQELVSARLINEPFVDGTCEKYKLNINDMRLEQNLRIFFSEQCISNQLTSADNINNEPTFWEKNKLVSYGLGVLAVGAGISYFKDKRVVIKTPALRF